ncbi:hypothetical protein CVT24_002825 [Panaeolus cyanescens]|uniref:DUF6593 domain-containing protein n=1 Tax=Panaeolus cyanescens TaxID=181874 RepID=A0A409YRG7_9AGAR|nr:hypothetical protein CVT24_002825 [Panaeolus cyanescens]
MILYLDSDDIWKATYTDEAGCIRYKFDVSVSIKGEEINLYKPRAEGSTKMELVGRVNYYYDNGKKEEARIKTHSDMFEDEGRLAGDVLRQSGPSGFTYGSYKSYAFTTENGDEFEWVFGYLMCSLHPVTVTGAVRETDNNLPPPVMTYHHSKFRLLSKSQKPTFEVDEGYEEILDTALITLAYLEKSRKVQERRRKGPRFFSTGWGFQAPV